MQTAPIWLEYVKTFGTIFVALVGAGAASVFAYRQWRTSHAKLVLDLFDRRYDLYKRLNGLIAGLTEDGEENFSDHDLRSFARAAGEARFLFGAEVVEYLESVRKDLGIIKQTERRRGLARLRGKDLDDNDEVQIASLARVQQFFERIDVLVAPYMIMDQKLPPKPEVRSTIKRWLGKETPPGANPAP